MSVAMTEETLAQALQATQKKHEDDLHTLYQARQQLEKTLVQLENKEKELPADADKLLLKTQKQHNHEFDAQEKRRRVATQKARFQVLIKGYEEVLTMLWETVTVIPNNPKLRKQIDKAYQKDATRIATHLSSHGNDADGRIKAAEKVIDGPFVTFAQAYHTTTGSSVSEPFAIVTQRLRADVLKRYADVCVRHDKERQQAHWAATHALAIRRHEHEISMVDRALDIKHDLYVTQSKIIALNRDIERAHQAQKTLQTRVPLEYERDAIIKAQDRSLEDLQRTLQEKRTERETLLKTLELQGREKEKNLEKRLRAELKQQADQILAFQQKKQHHINEINERYDAPEANVREKRHQLDKELKQHHIQIRHDLKALQETLTQAERALNQAQENIDQFMEIASEDFQERLHQTLTSWLAKRIDVEQDAQMRQHQLDIETRSQKKQHSAQKKHQIEMKKIATQAENDLKGLWLPLEELFEKTRKKLKSMKKATYAKIRAHIKPLHDQIHHVMEGWARQSMRAMKQAYKPFYDNYETQLKALRQDRDVSRKSETERLEALIEAHELGVAELKTHIDEAKKDARAEQAKMLKEAVQPLDERLQTLEQTLDEGLVKIKPRLAPFEEKLTVLKHDFERKMADVLKPFEVALDTLKETHARDLQALMSKKKAADTSLAKTSKAMRDALQRLEQDHVQALERNRIRHDEARHRF
ncbi:MAG: hypothetical protein EA374_07345 [Acholeplasmatales bacterium]|nr:MAG: hypothetical protein EA374_07345 [Acholeplasmatales bacterium]